MKNPFPGTLSCFRQPLTKSSLLCFKVFFPEEQTRLRQRSIPKDYTPNINNKVAHIITFLSDMCLSTWAGAVVSNSQLTNDRIQKRKASSVIVIAPGNKYPRSVMNDIKVCLVTN